MARNFPSAARQRPGNVFIAALVALMLAVTMTAVSSARADDLKDREKKVGKAVKEAAHDVHESSQSLQRAQQRLRKARYKLGRAQKVLEKYQAQVARAQRHDARVQGQLDAANARLVKARAELKRVKQQVVSQRRDMARMVVTNYQQGDPKLLSLSAMLSDGTPAEVTSQLNTADALMDRQVNLLEQLRAAEVRARELERSVYVLREKVEVKKAAAARVVSHRAGLEKRAAAARSTVAGLVSERASAQGAASRILANDKRILAKLKREEDKIRKLLLERARKSKGGYRGRAGGFLTRPVPGHVTSEYGYRKHPIYGYWGLHDGTDFYTDCGQDMKAVANGTVVSRYWSDVYGHRLVLDLGRVNGKSLAAVYNHATGYRVGVGQRVSRGQIVGDAGSTGWSTGCHLHFSVLVNGRTVDPMRWF